MFRLPFNMGSAAPQTPPAASPVSTSGPADIFDRLGMPRQIGGGSGEGSDSDNPIMQRVTAGMSPVFSALTGGDNKNAPQGADGAGSSAGNGDYARLSNGERSDLLTAMLARARGGQPGGAPGTPLPAPNSQAPVA